jgi:hypothetical protein
MQFVRLCASVPDVCGSERGNLVSLEIASATVWNKDDDGENSIKVKFNMNA